MAEDIIDYPEAFESLSSYLQEKQVIVKIDRGGYLLSTKEESFHIPMRPSVWPIGYTSKINKYITELKERNSLNALIHGKDPTENIVSCECKDGVATLFIEKDGIITESVRQQRYYILSGTLYGKGWLPLAGNGHYKYIKYYDSQASFYKDKRLYYGKDIFCINDAKESAMILDGFTYFKGMKVQDVSILSFDIESTGVEQNVDSHVLMISNTFRSQGKTTKKLFSLDGFSDEKEMLESWCEWVREMNPSIICGHNVFGFDLKYMDFCANKCEAELNLGRDGSKLWFNKYPSKFRKDGSQDYSYNRAFIYGREIVCTMFLAYHFDFARKYESYALKSIIKQEGLEKEGRQFYDAANIGRDWNDPAKRELIKKYGEDDADDALALYDLMIPAYFYVSSYVPKSFQTINYTASGSQLNSVLIRGYLQNGESIPKADEPEKFQGAISFGVPGVYSNMFKLDFNAMYPNIIRSFSIYSPKKDPRQYLLRMTNYFTEERLRNKKLFKETGNRFYYEMEQAAKVFINSIFGLMGAPGLNYNFPAGASKVTKIGRELLKFTVLWATNKDIEEWIKLFNEKCGNVKDEETMQDLSASEENKSEG